MRNQKRRNQKIWWVSLGLVVLGGVLIGLWQKLPALHPEVASVAASPSVPVAQKTVKYQTQVLPQAVVHILVIPGNSRYAVIPAISQSVETVEQFAQRLGAIAVLNGGFFDPENQQSTSYAVLQGKRVADPQQNARLINNPNLAPYLSKILNRSEFRRYRCGQQFRYAIAYHTDPAPPACQLVDALGGGPRLLPEITATQEGFLDSAKGQVTRDPLGMNRLNARSAVGITPTGDILWVMATQKPEAPANSGLSLPQMAALLKTLGAEQALNLDGGSSTSLVYQGKSFYGKLNPTGEVVKRPVKSVLILRDEGQR